MPVSGHGDQTAAVRDKNETDGLDESELAFTQLCDVNLDCRF